jgi:maleate isomerase
MINVGVLTPHEAAGADDELPLMSGGRVRTEVRHVPMYPGTSTPDAPETVHAIVYASTSTGYAIGARAERELVARLTERHGVPACSTSASAVDALRRFGAERLAVVHPPWFGEDRNAQGAKYFRDEGFTVVSAELADVTNDPARVTADEVVAWVADHVPDDAVAVFLGGNGFRVAHAIAPLEQRLGRLVLESNQVLLWSVNESLGVPHDIRSFGRLLDPRRKDH